MCILLHLLGGRSSSPLLHSNQFLPFRGNTPRPMTLSRVLYVDTHPPTLDRGEFLMKLSLQDVLRGSQRRRQRWRRRRRWSWMLVDGDDGVCGVVSIASECKVNLELASTYSLLLLLLASCTLTVHTQQLQVWACAWCGAPSHHQPSSHQLGNTQRTSREHWWSDELQNCTKGFNYSHI